MGLAGAGRAFYGLAAASDLVRSCISGLRDEFLSAILNLTHRYTSNALGLTCNLMSTE